MEPGAHHGEGWLGRSEVCVLGEVALDTLDVQRLSGCEKET